MKSVYIFGCLFLISCASLPDGKTENLNSLNDPTAGQVNDDGSTNQAGAGDIPDEPAAGHTPSDPIHLPPNTTETPGGDIVGPGGEVVIPSDAINPNGTVKVCHCPPGQNGEHCRPLNVCANSAIHAHLRNHEHDRLGDCPDHGSPQHGGHGCGSDGDDD